MKLDAVPLAAPLAISEAAGVRAAALPWVLPRLADLLGRNFTDTRMMEALPHAADAEAAAALLGAARRLGLAPRPWTRSAAQLPGSVLPALWVRADALPALVIGRTADFLLVESEPGEPPHRVHARGLPGRLYVFAGSAEAEAAGKRPLLTALLAEDAGAIAGLLGLSLVAAIASIALGGVVMLVFDMVVPSGDPTLLPTLAIGVAIALAAELAARLLLAHGIGRLGEQAERRILTAVFDKVMRLPWSAVAGGDPAAQVQRMREVEAAREVFAGPLPQTLLQAPLALAFLVAIFVLAGPLVLVPLVLLPLQALTALVLVPRARAAEQAAGALSAERRRMMLETLSHATALRFSGAEAAWQERFRGVSAAAALAQAKAARAAQALEGMAAAGLPVSAASMRALGDVLVIAGRISAGALVAAIMLSWRLLVPLQSFLLAGSRGRQVADAVRQLDRLERLAEERRPAADAPLPAPRDRTLRLEEVTYRPAPGAPAILVAATLALAPGTRVAVTGPAGAGKSTLLRVVLGLLQPQGGLVALGGVNIAQFDPQALRGRIGYLPQRPALIYGTVAQNLRLAAPLATDAELAETCDEIGILDAVQSLPQGFRTRLDDLGKERLPHSLRHGIALAQALLRCPDILLLDDPTRGLDAGREARLLSLLDRLRGQTAVLVATQRVALIRRCDAAYVLERGRLTAVERGAPGRNPLAPPPAA